MSNDFAEKLEKLRKRYREFLEWDQSNVDIKLTQISGEYAFWQANYVNAIKKRGEYEVELDKLWQGKWKYYKHQFDDALSNTEIGKFIEKDLDILTMRGKLSNHNSLVEFLSECMKNLNQLRWDIKSFIDWKNFQAGKH